MAINFTDFSRAPLQESPWKNMLENVLKGYQIEKEPAKMAEEQKQRELTTGLKNLEFEHKPKEYALNDQQKSLANALQDMALKHKPKEYSLADALAEANINKANKASVGLKLTGDIANYKVTHPDATDEDVRKFADRLLESKISHTIAGTERTGILNETQNQRGQTQQGKLLTEAKDVNEGFVPGTGRTQKFENPSVQKFYKDQYDLKLQQQRSDSVTRNRAIYAGLVDNTFNNIDVDKLVQYSGIEGEIDKRLAQGQLVPEEDQIKYREYKAQQANVQVLAKQIRQFYGDSISPGNLKKLEEISNPAKWSESPKAAKAQFEAFKKLVKQETEIYRGALSSIVPFQGDTNQSSQINNDNFDFSQYPVAGGR